MSHYTKKQLKNYKSKFRNLDLRVTHNIEAYENQKKVYNKKD